jgi:hypothetical protein
MDKIMARSKRSSFDALFAHMTHRKRPQKQVGRPLLDRIAAVNSMRQMDAALMAEVYAHYIRRSAFTRVKEWMK